MLRNGDSFYIDREQSWQWAEEMRPQYRSADPFPHVVLDGFLPDDFLDAIIDNFPSREHCSVHRQNAHAQAKWGYRPDDLGTNPCRSYLALFNSSPMLTFLEALTGIEGLIPDPHFFGGGMHDIGQGGKLDVHADFNLHKPLRLVRRINLLLYLNEDWKPEYGGNLELWKEDMSSCTKSLMPIRNRCVIFNTNKTSFHGHPKPLSCPASISRRSVAIYYYSSPLKELAPSDEVNTQTDFYSTG